MKSFPPDREKNTCGIYSRNIKYWMKKLNYFCLIALGSKCAGNQNFFTKKAIFTTLADFRTTWILEFDLSIVFLVKFNLNEIKRRFILDWIPVTTYKFFAWTTIFWIVLLKSFITQFIICQMCGRPHSNKYFYLAIFFSPQTLTRTIKP